MNFEPDDNQAAILDGLEQLITTQKIEPPKHATFVAFSETLDAELAASGFLDIAREDGFSPLDAALIVERIARLPLCAEVATSALVGPLFPIDALQRPLAMLRGSPLGSARFLPHARSLIVVEDENVSLISVTPDRVVPVESLFAYPYGRLESVDGLAVQRFGRDMVAPVLRRWRLSIAVEAAGLMEAALDTVLEHVKTRKQFGRALGSFQAVQHRLATAASTANATKWLALRAAWSDDEAICAMAATYAQDAIPLFTYDLHQFCGAMGLTLEFPLHLWTYRLKALLGELGGSGGQARAAAELSWADAA